MTLPLTVDTLRAGYDFLCTTPPFCRWNLPDGEEVVFRLLNTRQWEADHLKQRSRSHEIRVSRGKIGSTASLMEALAHEMIHLHEAQLGIARNGVDHSGAFDRFAAQVCRLHVFDPKRFAR